jgi:hypothetical protein
MTDNTRSYQRNVRGQFARVNIERDVLAPGLGVPEKFAYGLERRYAPAADDLAQGGQSSPLQPRFARVVSGGSERTVYATPHPATLRGAHTTDAGRPVGPEIRYIVGDVDETAPGELAATERYGIQGRRGRDAARRGADPMDPSRFLTGADDDE